MSASSPRTVLSFVKQPCWQVAPASGEAAKQASASGMSSKVSGQDERFPERFNGMVVVFIRARFCTFALHKAMKIDKMGLCEAGLICLIRVRKKCHLLVKHIPTRPHYGEDCHYLVWRNPSGCRHLTRSPSQGTP